MIRPLAFMLAVLLSASVAMAESSTDKRSLQSLFATMEAFDKLTGKAAVAGNWQNTAGEAVAMVAALAEKMAAYLDETGRISEITEVTPGQIMSPFAAAVSAGLAEVVDVYLRYPDVRARLNEPLEFHSIKGDRHWQARPWAIAAAAPLQGASFCGGEVGTLFFGYSGIAPYLEAHPGETPYRRILTALETAGANPNRKRRAPSGGSCAVERIDLATLNGPIPYARPASRPPLFPVQGNGCLPHRKCWMPSKPSFTR